MREIRIEIEDDVVFDRVFEELREFMSEKFGSSIHDWWMWEVDK